MKDEKETPVKDYQAPKLIIYGTLEELTKEGGNVGDDGLSGSKAAI